MHKYAPKYRPISFANVPDGCELLETGRDAFLHYPIRAAVGDLPQGRHPFGVVGYPSPLTPKQIEDYELTPV